MAPTSPTPYFNDNPPRPPQAGELPDNRVRVSGSPPRQQASPLVFVRPSVTAEVVRRAPDYGVALLEPTEIELLVQFGGEYSNIETALLRYVTQETPEKIWMDNQKAIGDSAAKGDAGQPLNSATFEDCRTRHQAHRRALQNTATQVSAKSIPILIAAADRLAKVAGLIADDIEKQERKLSEPFGVDFSPSRLLIELRSLALTARNKVPTVGGQSPAIALKQLGITLNK